MVRRQHRRPWIGATELAVRLHDAAAGLAVGTGLLKIDPEVTPVDRLRQTDQALSILVEVQANLKRLSSAFFDIAPRVNAPIDLQQGLKREANRLGVSVEIEVEGETSWLPANHAELIWLVSREGLRNVRRHSGSASCRIQLHLLSCPFVMRIRDWGGGLGPSAQIGAGIGLLREMAARMGCDLKIRSQPGLGTELVLVGPPCASERESSAVRATTARADAWEIHEPGAGNR